MEGTSDRFEDSMGICECNAACLNCDSPSPSCQAHLDQGLDPSSCCACSDLRPNNEHLCPDGCRDAEDCQELLGCPGICDQTDPLAVQLVGVTMHDVAAFVELVHCIEDSPVESCVAPLESGTWELGECQGPVIARAEPMVNLRNDPEMLCGESHSSYVNHCVGCAAPSWNCFGWYDETTGWCEAEQIAVEVTRSDGTIESQYVSVSGCYPPDWQMAVHPMHHGWGEFCPPDWILSDWGCVPDDFEMEPGSEPEIPDPWIQPHPLYADGLSKEECLEFCNTHKAGCCSTDDGRYADKGGTLELVQEPWGCAAYELKWHPDDVDSVQFPYQDPRREEWFRITVTTVEPQVDSSIMTPDIAKQMTCEALCDNEMACGGWNLDPYEQINCARYELRPGLTSQERCLARQENPSMCLHDDCLAAETVASCAEGYVMIMTTECEVMSTETTSAGLSLNVCKYKCVENTELCEWNEDDQLCEPKRECGTQCKMWYVTHLFIYPRACETLTT